MRHSHCSIARSVAVAAAAVFVSLGAGCSKPTDANSAGTDSAFAARSASKLGDLTSFRIIVADAANFVDEGNLAAAKTRIKDLEVAWDSAEASLRPRAPDDWQLLDKAIDRALAALLADPQDSTDCNAAMEVLLETLNTLSRS